MSDSSDKILELIQKLDNPEKIKLIIEIMQKAIDYTNDKTQSEYLNYMTELLKIKNATQMAHEIASKLHLAEPIYDATEDDQFKWKCTARIPNTDLVANGYNNKKSEAKSKKFYFKYFEEIASEQLILEMSKTKLYGTKLRKIIKKDYEKLAKKETKEQVCNIEQNEDDLINRINNELTDDKNIENCQIKKFVGLEFEERIILDFEILSFKWERYLIVDRQYTEIESIFDTISNSIMNRIKVNKYYNYHLLE
jgi:hypothetical protein